MNVLRKIFTDKDALKGVVLLVLLCILFFPVLVGMYKTWLEDSNNSHGILVPFIVIYLIFDILKRQNIADYLREKRKMTMWGGVFLLVFLSLYAFAVITDIVFFKNLSFLLSLLSIVVLIYGIRVFLCFLFPSIFIFFMIPIPTTVYTMMALPMQLFATKISVFILSFTSMPVSADGNIIRVGNEMLTVAEACSGLRSLMSFIMISILFAYLAKTNFLRKILLVFVSVPVALVGNILRILILTFVAYIYGSKTAVHLVHDVSGYVMLVVAFAVFFWLAKKIEK